MPIDTLSFSVRISRAVRLACALALFGGCTSRDGDDAGSDAGVAGAGGSGGHVGGHRGPGSSGTGGAAGDAGLPPGIADGGTGDGFAQTVHPMLVMTCSTCHAGNTGPITPHQGSGPGEFGLEDVDAAYAAALRYVVPGEPDASKLYIKISQDAPSTGGQRMPPLIPLLDEQIELVRSWIESGAPPD